MAFMWYCRTFACYCYLYTEQLAKFKDVKTGSNEESLSKVWVPLMLVWLIWTVHAVVVCNDEKSKADKKNCDDI